MVVARGWKKGGIGNYFLMGIEFLFYKVKSAMEIDGGDSYTL